MIPLLLLACTGATVGDGTETTPGATGVPTPVLSVPNGRTIDPTLPRVTELNVAVALPERPLDQDCVVDVEIVGSERLYRDATVELPWGDDATTVVWDGKDADGEPIPAGLFELFAWAECADGSRGSASIVLASVRLLPQTLDVGAVDPADDVPLAFHKTDLVTVDPQTITGPEYHRLGTTSPAPWADPDVPPWSAASAADDPATVDHNVPAGLVAGATPTLTVGVDETGIPAGVDVSVDGEPWADGLVRTLDPLDATVGREIVEVDWVWTTCFQGDCGTVAWPTPTEHEIYRLLGPSQLRDGSADGYSDGTPWIGTLADTADAVEGAADGFEILDGLRDRVHDDPWLIYDPGDRSYSQYDGSYIYWDSITSELSSWLDRQDGLSLYCHSVSCLLSTLGQTWGVDAEQIVLGVGFQTNLARAAGSDSWGRWYFNSHSVVTLDDGGHVWDASIDVDGDDDPYNQPVDAVSPKGMPGDEYFWRLTYDDIDIVNQGKCFVR